MFAVTSTLAEAGHDALRVREQAEIAVLRVERLSPTPVQAGPLHTVVGATAAMV